MENEISGVLLVNKHKGVTSHDIVFKIRRLYGTKKVGHTGTLDPMATGVLPVLIGRSAKAAEYLLCEDKKYIAEIKLGLYCMNYCNIICLTLLRQIGICL